MGRTSRPWSGWVPFPENHPDRTRKLVRYPMAGETQPESVPARSTIDDHYGALLGWSASTPRAGMVVECRGTGD